MAYNGTQKFKIARMPQWKDSFDVDLTFTTNKTLTDTDGYIQRLSNNTGSPLDVILPAGANGDLYIIANAGNDNIVVKNATGTTIGTIAGGKGHMFAYDEVNSNWYNLFLGN
tara:strand:+ start:2089 stop:2424 length:336 start_codon:yes stop_codon:yes gene_type:complete